MFSFGGGNFLHLRGGADLVKLGIDPICRLLCGTRLALLGKYGELGKLFQMRLSYSTDDSDYFFLYPYRFHPYRKYLLRIVSS